MKNAKVFQNRKHDSFFRVIADNLTVKVFSIEVCRAGPRYHVISVHVEMRAYLQWSEKHILCSCIISPCKYYLDNL